MSKLTKDKLLEEMKQFDIQTLSIAYAYAKNLTMYGVNVTEKWITAIEQSVNLDKAYRRGFEEALDSINKHIGESEESNETDN